MTSRTKGQREERPDDSLSRVAVAIAVTDEACSRIDQVAAACRRLGLEHTSTLAGVGVLLGSVDLGDLPKLRTLPHVAAVEIKREARVCGLPAPCANQRQSAAACASIR
jgi:hypothetical protein